LHCRQQQSNQNADNGDHNKQFNQCEPRVQQPLAA
jgi:hypothetical protein